MSAEKYATYADAYREFRMNVAENDFHDDYPETAEMTLAICSGLRYHYMRNYRSLTTDQTIQLIETFAKRHTELDQYEDTLDISLYGSESIIKHKRWCDDSNPRYNEWLLLCHAYGLIYLTPHYQENFIMNLADENSWVKRNMIQLKLLDRDIKRRIEIQQKLIEMGRLNNDIDKFNHIYKYIPTHGSPKLGRMPYKYIIDSYYDGHVDERLGTDTIYEWILNDDIDRFQQWYNDGGLREYISAERGNDKNTEYIANIAAHILASNAAKIIRFVIMNNVREFLEDTDEGYALMDPWRHPVNDPECFRLLQERFMKDHESIITVAVNSGYEYHIAVNNVYRYIQPEIAEAIYHEISEISMRLCGTDAIYFRLYVAVEIAKFGHIGPIESLDWEAITRTLSDKNSYTFENSDVIIMVTRLIESKHELINKPHDYLPLGMNPSTAVYLHDLFVENGLVDIDLLKTILHNQYAFKWIEGNQVNDNQIDMSSL